MRVEKLLHNRIKKSVSIHSKRLESLMCAARVALESQEVTVTGLGRNLKSKIKVKHKIKKMDRLVGNVHLTKESVAIYAAITKLVLGGTTRPVIIIDWSPLGDGTEYYILRASFPMGGRAVTIYESCHLEEKLTNRTVHQQFLRILAQVLPQGCKPIIVTDAGFRNTWFKDVEAMNWDWVGRVRNKTFYKLIDDVRWEPIKSIYSKATNTPKFIGECELAKSNSIRCGLYLYQKKPKGRKIKNLRGEKRMHTTSLHIAQREREPWLIATSLKPRSSFAKKIVRIYTQRMQIENSFRDTKNQRVGFSLSDSKTKSTERFNHLLLIIAIATIGLWLVGAVAKQRKWQYNFQANTTKSKEVLSNVFLGAQVIQHCGNCFSKTEFLDLLRKCITTFNLEFDDV